MIAEYSLFSEMNVDFFLFVFFIEPLVDKNSEALSHYVAD